MAHIGFLKVHIPTKSVNVGTFLKEYRHSDSLYIFKCGILTKSSQAGELLVNMWKGTEDVCLEVLCQ